MPIITAGGANFGSHKTWFEPQAHVFHAQKLKLEVQYYDEIVSWPDQAPNNSRHKAYGRS